MAGVSNVNTNVLDIYKDGNWIFFVVVVENSFALPVFSSENS